MIRDFFFLIFLIIFIIISLFIIKGTFENLKTFLDNSKNAKKIQVTLNKYEPASSYINNCKHDVGRDLYIAYYEYNNELEESSLLKSCKLYNSYERLPIGTKKEVYYNPSKPNICFYSKSNIFDTILLPIIILSILFTVQYFFISYLFF